MNTSLEDTKFILKKYGIIANKKLGQNFLVDDNVIDTIVQASSVGLEDLVIEIGPRPWNINGQVTGKGWESNCH